ncbi:hypothetical protein CAPTEDRAFT_195686 [Capitella teleta]|uniref:G-protein coupled receptors family 1 profile domain-containing protein n=1 Tax=Capitella teleta TaxID=283909 RepID=X1ZVD8_CAPTE|nr:hypothetical protein CAPTEDRAFT_195686 [Capitella teleta]|eukprot:ELT88400.1 hypothetical protein CAPTEDRAFT_195686 [Capitella teleta]
MATEVGNFTVGNITEYVFFQRNMLSVVRTCVSPFYLFVGFGGNPIGSVVFLVPYLRRKAFSIFLAAMSISDAIFLGCLLVSWSSHVDLESVVEDKLCQPLIFLTLSRVPLSQLCVVVFTVDLFLNIHMPSRKLELCSSKSAKLSAGLSQPLTQETLSFADAVGHPQNSHPLQQTPTSTRSTTTSKKRLPPTTSQHVDPAKTLVVAKPADPIRLQNTMNLQTSLNERDRSIVPLIATAKVVSNGNLFVEAKTTEDLDELRNKIAPLTSDLFGEAASLRLMDDSKTRPKHVIIRNVPAHYDADTILEEARVEYSSASSVINLTKPGSTARRRPIKLSLDDSNQ